MATEQENQEEIHLKEGEENIQYMEGEQEATVEIEEQEQAKIIDLRRNNQWAVRSSFVHGLSVGLGIGCLATFVIIWIAVFFTPQLPSSVTYESLLSIFIYPMVYY
ncbi:MAG: hypothetical protein QW468_00535 [Candidatus Bathyarchaeia archaeon]